MGLGNRPYWKDDQPGGSFMGGYYGSGMRHGLPKPTPAVMWLLIVNFAMFILQNILGGTFTLSLSAVPMYWWQPWRYVTFQFLHGGVMHILFNMLGLYFLGVYLERAWGTKRFLGFYLTCGVIAGLTHVAFSFLFRQPTWVPLVGASGGVLAVLAACAILFPHIQVVLLLFPVPIRFAAILFIVISVLFMLTGEQGGTAHAAHFGGMVAGGVWVWLGPRLRNAREGARQRINHGAWERKVRREQQNQAEVDRILDKIRREGIQSLSAREKRILQDATEKQRKQDQKINRL